MLFILDIYPILRLLILYSSKLHKENIKIEKTASINRVYSFSYFVYGIYKPREIKKIR